jgi:hypothetical protein
MATSPAVCKIHVHTVALQADLNKFLLYYCTITTLGSQSVTHDGHEQYQTKFIGGIFV